MLVTFRRGVPLLCLLSGVFAAPQACGEDQKFTTPVGTIVLDIDSQWRPTELAADGITGLAYEVGSGGRTMNFMMGTVDGVNEQFGPEDVRNLAEEMRKAEDTEGKSVTEVKAYTGSRANGVYFQATGTPGVAPKAGEYRWMIAGVVVTGAAPMIFTIAWNEGGKAAADRAFAAVKGLRIEQR